MKKFNHIIGVIFIYILMVQNVYAQQGGVGINTDNSEPDPSAMLDVKSTTKGAVFPRMTEAQRIAIGTPATGLLVYQTDKKAGYYYFDGTNWTQLSTQSGSAPVGTILSFAGKKSEIPDGWIICDGREYSRTDYADLYAVIGTAWGAGNHSTTFNVPDLRGMFLRGVNDGRTGNFRDPDFASRTATNGGNSGDNVGSVQTDGLKSHQHESGSLGGTTTTDGNHTHTYQMPVAAGNGDDAHDRNFHHLPANHTTSPAGAHSHNLNITGNTANEGGSETRPNNAYVYYIIKF